jgi:hypothetical protein
MASEENHLHIGTERGETTIDVQKLLDKPWYRYRHLRKLYGWLCVVLIVQATNGLDGSIMNGMQTLTYWVSPFHSLEHQILISTSKVTSITLPAPSLAFSMAHKVWVALFRNSSCGGWSRKSDAR